MYLSNYLRLNGEILSRFLIIWENVSREASERVRDHTKIKNTILVFFISIICMSTLNYLLKVCRKIIIKIILLYV